MSYGQQTSLQQLLHGQRGEEIGGRESRTSTKSHRYAKSHQQE